MAGEPGDRGRIASGEPRGQDDPEALGTGRRRPRDRGGDLGPQPRVGGVGSAPEAGDFERRPGRITGLPPLSEVPLPAPPRREGAGRPAERRFESGDGRGSSRGHEDDDPVETGGQRGDDADASGAHDSSSDGRLSRTSRSRTSCMSSQVGRFRAGFRSSAAGW